MFGDGVFISTSMSVVVKIIIPISIISFKLYIIFIILAHTYIICNFR